MTNLNDSWRELSAAPHWSEVSLDNYMHVNELDQLKPEFAMEKFTTLQTPQQMLEARRHNSIERNKNIFATPVQSGAIYQITTI